MTKYISFQFIYEKEVRTDPNYNKDGPLLIAVSIVHIEIQLSGMAQSTKVLLNILLVELGVYFPLHSQ